MELNNIKSSNLNWGDAAKDLNQNFGKINNAIEQVKNVTTRNKGYFTTVEALNTAYPNGANVGDYGYVGTSYPFNILKWDGSNWYDTGVKGGENVELENYYTKSDADDIFLRSDNVVQELGNNENAVPSQKLVTEKLKESELNINTKIAEVKSEISSIGDLARTNEDGFFVTDEDGNIGMSVDKDGNLDALGFGEHLNSIIDNKMEESSINTRDIEQTSEKGMFVTDEDGNLAAMVDENGRFDCIGFGRNIGEINKDFSRKMNVDLFRHEESMSKSLIKMNDGAVHNVSINTEKKKWIQPIRLHYGSSKGTPAFNDVFFDGKCNKDFSDVRFFDQNGKALKVFIGNPINCDIIEDSRLYGGAYLFACPNGNLVASGGSMGVRITTDGGVTWESIKGTYDVTPNASAVYGLTTMCAVFVDSNNDIFAYRGGKLYKLTYSDNYTTQREVLDFSWVYEGRTIYPDIQPHAMDKDINGNYFIGVYQDERHPAIYSSTNGENWVLSNLPDDVNIWHIHHIHADKYSSKVYVGIDGDNTKRGPVVLMTSNGGQTWTDVSYTLREQRGRDYFPSYFGKDYFLGGGESFVLGGDAIAKYDYKTNKITKPLKGFAGVRSFADFGNDNLLITGTQSNTCCQANQILASYDQGNTWDILIVEDVNDLGTSGSGYRQCINAFPLKGEQEPCAILVNGTKTKKVYKGGDNYFCEAYILVEEATSVRVESGYKPMDIHKQVKGYDNAALVYNIPCDEGAGGFIQDSDGRVIPSSVLWEKDVDVVRYGEYSGIGGHPYKKITSAIKTLKPINFGKIDKLNFAKDYTITFWLNEKAVANEYAESESNDAQFDDIARVVFSIGNYSIIRFNAALGLSQKDKAYPRYSAYVEGGLRYSDNYNFFAIVVKNGIAEFYLNGSSNFKATGTSFTDFNAVKLSDSDLIIGSDILESAGYVSDIKIYNSPLSREEIVNIYKGYQFN